MKIQKLNEAIMKTITPRLCYGAKTGTRTLCFGAYKQTGYNVLLVNNMGVKGGSQVCFETIEDFEIFNNHYFGGELSLIKRSLNDDNLPLYEVDTIYGKVYMKADYMRDNPPVKKSELNKAKDALLDTVNTRSMINLVDSKLKELMLPTFIEAFDEIGVDIDEERSHIHVGTANNLICYIYPTAPVIVDDTLKNELEEILGSQIEIYKLNHADALHIQIQIPAIDKLYAKFKNEVINKISAIDCPQDINPEIWELAKKSYLKI